MKKLISVLLVVMIAAGWVSAVFTNTSTSAEYQGNLETAQDYKERGLYEKAIAQYDIVLAEKSSGSVWAEKMETYALWYAEDTDCYSDYLSAAQEAVAANAKNVSYVCTLAELYMDNEKYASAVEAIETAMEAGLEDDSLSELLTEAKYAYSIGWKNYTAAGPLSGGYYAVALSGEWAYIGADGSVSDYDNLVFAGPVGEDTVRVMQDDTRAYLTNDDGTVEGILDFTPEAAGVYAEGLVPICKDGSYGYYDILGDYQFGDYDYAGTFTDGKAAVCDGGIWYLIDTDGEKASDETYDDIVLCEDGTYLLDKVMVAAQNGVYSIYTDGKAAGSYEDADMVTADGIIAVCTGGLWGYVNLEGEEVIAPAYEEALSFSNGLAAVSIDGMWGFIDTSGELVIENIFYGASYFNSEGCCMAETADGTQWQLLTLEAGV